MRRMRTCVLGQPCKLFAAGVHDAEEVAIGIGQDDEAGAVGVRPVDAGGPERYHEPACCSACAAVLSGAPEAGAVRRQVTDVPEVRAEVTEHQMIGRRCGCGTVTWAEAPAGVNAPVQYGPRAAAIGVYLWHGQFLSRDRTWLLWRACSAALLLPARWPPWQERPRPPPARRSRRSGTHLLREVNAVTETGTADDVTWAGQAIDALLEPKKAADESRAAGRPAISAGVLSEHSSWFRQAAAAGTALNAARHEISWLDALTPAAQGKPWIPQTG